MPVKDIFCMKPVDERVLYSKIMGLVKQPAPIPIDDPHEAVQAKILKYTNLSYLIQRTKSNPTLMLEMISAYLEQTPPLIQAMTKSFQDKDWGLLHATVHKMIPSFSIMGISADFEGMAKKIMEYAIKQQQTEGIPDLVVQLENICTQACRELEAEYNAIKNTHQ